MSDPMLGTIRDGRHPDHFCGISPCPHIPASQQRVERGGPVTALTKLRAKVEAAERQGRYLVAVEFTITYADARAILDAAEARQPLLDALKEPVCFDDGDGFCTVHHEVMGGTGCEDEDGARLDLLRAVAAKT